MKAVPCRNPLPASLKATLLNSPTKSACSDSSSTVLPTPDQPKRPAYVHCFASWASAYVPRYSMSAAAIAMAATGYVQRAGRV
jgi:hypothetical protein